MTRVSAAVDAVSQTIKVVARVEQAPVGVLPGMSGRATLEGAAAASATPMASTPGPVQTPAGKLPVQAVYHVPAGSEGQPPAVMPIPSAPSHATPSGSVRVGAPGSSNNGIR
ncbi:hypothetical protein D3C73_760760 [compost metagenome]